MILRESLTSYANWSVPEQARTRQREEDAVAIDDRDESRRRSSAGPTLSERGVWLAEGDTYLRGHRSNSRFAHPPPVKNLRPRKLRMRRKTS